MPDFINIGWDLFLTVNQAFTPTQLAGAVHWYRADLGITLSGSNVAQWNDQIGTAHLLQATAANQPAYNAADAGYSGQPTVQSTAVNMFLASGAVAGLPQPFTIWLVGEFSTASGTAMALAASTSGRPAIYRTSGNVTADANTPLSSGVPSNAKHATLATFNAASSFVGVDNWLTGGVAGSAGAAPGTTSGISVFAYTNGLVGSIGKFVEMIVQAGVPTSAEKTNMAAYFARYGITVT